MRDGSADVTIDGLPGRVEVQWYDANGALVKFAEFEHILGFDMSMEPTTDDAVDLPTALRGELRQQISSRSLSDRMPMPWIRAERAASLRLRLFPPVDADFHLFETVAEHRAFVRGFILRRERSGRVIIADPYLDRGVFASYMLRKKCYVA